MRFPYGRRFAAFAVPFALVVGALAFTAVPAQAIRNCTTNQVLLAEAQAAENEGDSWVYAEEFLIDEGNYEDANYADRLDHYAHQLRRLHDEELGEHWRHESASDAR